MRMNLQYFGGRGGSGSRNSDGWYNASPAVVESATVGDKMRVTRLVGIRQREETTEYTLQTEYVAGYEEPQPVWVPNTTEYSRIRFGSNVTDLFNDESVKEVKVRVKRK